jgi:hypothetical protein
MAKLFFCKSIYTTSHIILRSLNKIPSELSILPLSGTLFFFFFFFPPPQFLDDFGFGQNSHIVASTERVKKNNVLFSPFFFL